ncbi:MAG: hypothetical protein AUG48_11420 [Actinobacteria bacterium 13_1_20CM_3_68_9]|nr:MAG: hypothetical protein AUG48_11420 [Actinobacteria bacterium 13_1_20CM_3_68_9]
MATGLRPAGSSRRTVASRSPYAVSESVRGIGVAVLVDHADGESREVDVGLDQGVRPHDHRELARGQTSEGVTAARPGRGAREQREGNRSQAPLG